MTSVLLAVDLPTLDGRDAEAHELLAAACDAKLPLLLESA